MIMDFNIFKLIIKELFKQSKKFDVINTMICLMSEFLNTLTYCFLNYFVFFFRQIWISNRLSSPIKPENIFPNPPFLEFFFFSTFISIIICPIILKISSVRKQLITLSKNNPSSWFKLLLFVLNFLKTFGKFMFQSSIINEGKSNIFKLIFNILFTFL